MRKRDRCAPYTAEHSAAMDTHRARRECRLAKLAAKRAGAPSLARIASQPGHGAQRLGRALVNAGAEIDNARGEELRRAKEREVPAVNTSYGIGIEDKYKHGVADVKRHRVFVAVLKLRDHEAMGLLAAGKPDKAMARVIDVLAG